MEVHSLAIEAVKLLKPRRFTDSRGYFAETYNAKTAAEAGITTTFVQDNQSLSARRGTIRGLHFQVSPEPQAKLVRVLSGAVFDVVVDLRQGSSTYGRWCSATLTSSGGEQLYCPVGFAHGFCTLEDETEVLYKVDGFYNMSCEAGISWCDADLAIRWPIQASEVRVSEKDARLPGFMEGREKFSF